MKEFNSDLHTMTKSKDGSYTAYSKEYDEHYHSTNDGALNESLVKHVYPAFKIKENLSEINILDICFGLGFNTLATLYYHKKNSLTSKLNIYSPELDSVLVESLKNFDYPDEFKEFENIITELCEHGVYDDEYYHIELFIGDAREYIKRFENKFAKEDEGFDIVYQDAFSPSSNPVLWTKEYFRDIKNIIKSDGVITTYSTALAVRLALYENGFNIYISRSGEARDSTVASLNPIDDLLVVDMPHKISCNPDSKPLLDNDI